MLLLHSNEAISADRLTAELWGDSPPGDAAAALQAHVSRLRKLLGPRPPIETAAAGYRLRVDSDALDLLRFEALVQAGRRCLEAGDAAEAARELTAALELWRGRPLADLDGQAFAQEAIGELEERRLAAVETRIDADIELGRHAELVAELTALAHQHPLRERVHAQLMLALYRAGRQAEALDAYAALRRTLIEELGLEPSPEVRSLQEAILRHDPQLLATLAPRRSPPRRSPSRRRRGRVAGGAVAVVTGVALVTGALVLRLGGGDRVVPMPPQVGSVAIVAPGEGRVVARIAVGATPSALAVADGSVWVVNADDQTVSKIDARSRAVQTFGVGATPTDVAAGMGAVWVGGGGQPRGEQSAGLVAASLKRLDPYTHAPRATIPLPRGRPLVVDTVAEHVATGPEGVWAIGPDGRVLRIDPVTNRVVAEGPALRARAIAIGNGSVWALAATGEVTRIDARTASIVGRGRVNATAVSSIVAGAGGAWVSAPDDGAVWRIEPGAGEELVMHTIPVSKGTTGLAFGSGALWAVNPLRGTLARIADGSVRTIPVGGYPRAVAVGGGSVWVATAAPGATEPPVTGAGRAAASCERSFYAGSQPAQRVVVSDLPLQGGLRLSSQQMTDAMAYVLRRSGFRAGRFRVAYQSCDDAVAATRLPDAEKCAANARGYGRRQDVLVVVGPLSSGCVLAEIPELGRAREPLAMVSPLASSTALTRATPGAPPRLPATLYPDGRRTFLRVFPTDSHQAAALALLARRLGRTPVFVLDDGDNEYGRVLAAQFARSARALGLPLAGRSSWNAEAHSQAQLAARVARSGARAVFLGGRLDTGGPAVLRALRRRLGTQVPLLAPDGFTPLPVLIAQAGRTATTGTFVSLPGVANASDFGTNGRRFARELGAALGIRGVQPSAIYAAQAMQVALDAIARSDGTRDSVRRALFATNLRDGLIGRVRFDANGDVSSSPVTILRVAPGTQVGPEAPDAAVDRVVLVPADAVR